MEFQISSSSISNKESYLTCHYVQAMQCWLNIPHIKLYKFIDINSWPRDLLHTILTFMVQMTLNQLNFKPNLIKELIFPCWKWTCFSQRVCVAREIRLEGKWGVTRSSNSSCVITWQRAWFFTNRNHTLPISQLLCDHGITHHASRTHECVVLEKQGLKWKCRTMNHRGLQQRSQRKSWFQW